METLLNNAVWIIFLVTGSIILYREYTRYLERNIMTPDDLQRLLRPKVSEIAIALVNKVLVSLIVAAILCIFLGTFPWYLDLFIIVLSTNLMSIHIYRLLRRYIY